MKKIKPVKISNSIIYDNSFIYLQSMCSFGYDNKTELENQILELSKTNCSLIRLSIRNENEIEIAKKFKDKYERDDFVFVADTHFLPKLAILSIKNGFKKVRINPGNMNFTDMNLIAKIAKDYDATIRIGLNGGSVYEKLGPYNISKIEQKNGQSNEKYISDKYIKKIIDLFSKYLEPFEKQGF
ncbi:MAG TPA: flavodoxin-dependent (E)-4-hydroxy-3-methylbut-2-enyl-diphosphate synthase, partial [Exilispira sp.]|nr:flavodoxin-dependent (E)-4-hydroxy-3-methylbut-2-enyl-diphosphate synthase [Exilispira sp.]